jgi:tRNA(Ile)-lysidine synthase
MTDAVRDAAFAAMDRRLDPNASEPLAVAVSGGGDSMALMHFAAAWGARHRRSLSVLTVDHGLNPASPAWAGFVAHAAERLGFSTRVLRWGGDKPETGLPAAARAARHALLADAARKQGARVLLMGHTADDLLETHLMREEGSTVGHPDEWTPSPAWPEGRGLFLLRPLLTLRRAALRAWLGEEGERWIEDPANADTRYARGRARAYLAQNPGFSGPEIRTLQRLEDHPPLSAFVQAEPGGLLVLRRDWLRDLFDPSAILCRAIASAAGRSGQGGAYKAFGLAVRLKRAEAVGATLAGARIETRGRASSRGPRSRAGAGSPARPQGPERPWCGTVGSRSKPTDPGVIRPLAGRDGAAAGRGAGGAEAHSPPG